MFSMNDTISNLKFIASVQEGNKINTKFMFLQNDSYTSKLSRSIFYNDTRTNTIKFIQGTLESAFHILFKYKNSKKLSDKQSCLNIINDLTRTKLGLNNLKYTYKSDTKFVCDVDMIIENIDVRMKDINIDDYKFDAEDYNKNASIDDSDNDDEENDNDNSDDSLLSEEENDV